MGAIGLSGRFYEFSKEVDYSLDNLYSNGIDGYQLYAKQAGEPYGPGVFKFSSNANVELNEEGIEKVIYQDENGDKFEIPIQ